MVFMFWPLIMMRRFLLIFSSKIETITVPASSDLLVGSSTKKGSLTQVPFSSQRVTCSFLQWLIFMMAVVPLESGVDDGEVNAVTLRSDNIRELNFLSFHVDIVTTEAHRRGDVNTVGVVQEAEGLEIERILSSDVGSLVGGVDVASNVIVTSVHHEGEVAGVEFGVSSVSDLHDVELGVLLGVDFEILLHGVPSHETHGAHSHRDLGEHQPVGGVSEGMVVPEVAVLVGDGANADTLVGSICLNSVEDLLLLHQSFVVHLGDKADGVAGSKV